MVSKMQDEKVIETKRNETEISTLGVVVAAEQRGEEGVAKLVGEGCR